MKRERSVHLPQGQRVTAEMSDKSAAGPARLQPGLQQGAVSVPELVDTMRARGIRFRRHGDRITVIGKLTEEQRRLLNEHRAEIRALVLGGHTSARSEPPAAPSSTSPASQHDEPTPRLQCGLSWRGEPVYVSELDVRDAMRALGDAALEAYATGGIYEFMPMTKRRAYTIARDRLLQIGSQDRWEFARPSDPRRTTR